MLNLHEFAALRLTRNAPDPLHLGRAEMAMGHDLHGTEHDIEDAGSYAEP